MVTIISLIVLSLVCAITYRLGGIGKPFKTWMRDWVIPVLIYTYFLIIHHPTQWYGWLMWIPCIVLTGGALTTYWDELFGFDNFWFSGFIVAMGAFPLYWAGVSWYSIVIRMVVLAVLWGGWSAWIGQDWLEEGGRGFFISITLPLLLI